MDITEREAGDVQRLEEPIDRTERRVCEVRSCGTHPLLQIDYIEHAAFSVAFAPCHHTEAWSDLYRQVMAAYCVASR